MSEIAFQKAGIIKEGGICLVPDSVAPEARRVIEKEAAARHAEALFVKPYFEIFSPFLPSGYPLPSRSS